MKHEDFVKELRQDPEYVAAEKELKPILDIAKDVVCLRLAKGWSQSELARRVGTRQANISKLENGLGNPTLALLRKVAQALETELTVRMGPEPTPEPTSVIVKQEMWIVHPEVTWSSKRLQSPSPTQWRGFTSSDQQFNQMNRYKAA